MEIEDPFERVDGVDESACQYREPVYPRLQWLNSTPDKKALGEKFGCTGGLLFPEKEWRKAGNRPDWPIESVRFRVGESKAYVNATPELVVIQSRKCWVRENGNKRTYFPWNKYDDGMKGRYQFLVAVRNCKQVFVLSGKNNLGMAMEAALNEHETLVISAANAISEQRRRPYDFYMKIAPGDFIEVGKAPNSSIISPPAIVLPEKVDREFLVQQFVGKEAMLFLQEAYRSSERWAALWNDPRNLQDIADDDSHESSGGEDPNERCDWACGPKLADAYGAVCKPISQSQELSLDEIRRQMREALGGRLEEAWTANEMEQAIGMMRDALKNRQFKLAFKMQQP